MENNEIENHFKKKGYKIHSFSRIGKVKELSELLSTQDNELMEEIKTISEDYNKSIINQIFRYIDEYDRGKDTFVIKISEKRDIDLVMELCPDKYKNNITTSNDIFVN